MNRERDDLIESLFHDAIELPPEQRERFVCGATDDVDVRREAMSLLGAHGRAGAFLGRSAIDEGAHHDAVADQFIGHTIGPYRVIDRIASGGMGTVYRAERADEEFDKTVAIKLIRAGFDSGSLLNRFRHERQVLANLDHPNIARLLDGGSTDPPQSLPYLVMEHVQGTRIDRYADQRCLTIEQRLDLFLTVCDALQHAHQNLVIHRDLKPSNILVADDGTVKLLDFGIAKMLTPAADELAAAVKHDVTVTIERMLTPAYASPEQVRGRPVATATDIYSLGVILYELLTGHRPHRIDQATFEEASRAICEDAPTRPSTAVMQTAPAAIGSSDQSECTTTPEQIAANRSTDPARLRRTLRGDLENIILMALRKEPTRRYATVEQFAEDIRRYRQHLPIIARPDTLRYRSSKFMRRHRASVAAATMVVLALSMALVISIFQHREAEAARIAEQHQRRLAEASAIEAAQVNRFLTEMLRSVHPNRARGRDVELLREVLENATTRLDASVDLPPLVEASLRHTIGSVWYGIGDYGRAEANLRRAFDLRREFLGMDHVDTAATLTMRGYAALDAGREDEALAHHAQAIEIFQGIGAMNNARFIDSLMAVAQIHSERGNFPDAEAMLATTIEVLRNHPGDPLSNGANSDERLLDAMNLHGSILARQGRFAEAEPLFREFLERSREVRDDDHPQTIIVMNNLAMTLRNLKKHEEAEAYYEQAGALARRVFGEEHRITLGTIRNHALVLQEVGRTDEANEILTRVLAVQLRVLGSDHPDTLATQHNRAHLLSSLGQLDEALPVLRENVEANMRVHGPESPFTAGAMCDLARVMLQYHDPAMHAEIERLLLGARAIVVDKLPSEHGLVQVISNALSSLYGPDHMNDPAKLAAVEPRQ